MLKNKSGFSLMEIIIAIAVIGIFFSAVTLVYFTIGKGIMISRTRTVATNLAQEKIESLKNTSYFRLRPTSQSDYVTYGYDNTYYPPEEGILIGDIPYERRVVILRAGEDASGDIITYTPGSTGDTGLKKVVVTVYWTEKDVTKLMVLSNLRDNPNRKALDGVISGTVTDRDTFLPLTGVQVVIENNLNWNSITDAAGWYSIKVPTGTYAVKATKDIYWPHQSASMSVDESGTTYDFDLDPRDVGYYYGYVYINNQIVIGSVASKFEGFNGENYEWIELYNPTTFNWTIDPSSFTLYHVNEGNNETEINLIYFSTFVPPHKYYLIANTGTITMHDRKYIDHFTTHTVTADAVYQGASFQDIIKENRDGGVWFRAWREGLEVFDGLVWANAAPGPAKGREGDAVISPNGLEEYTIIGRCYYGTSLPYIASYYSVGKCYDSNNNLYNFESSKTITTDGSSSLYSLKYPRSTQYSASKPYTGRPAIGAKITCDDGVSVMTESYMTGVGTNENSYFRLNDVATGTWNLSFLYQGTSYFAYVSSENVHMPKYTSPDRTYLSYVKLDTAPVYGLVSGKVLNGFAPVPGIKVESGTSSTFSNAAGDYTLQLQPGSYFISANLGNLNPSYTSVTASTPIVVFAGLIINGIDFDISPGGSISGIVVSDGGDRLPDTLVMAFDLNGNEVNSVLTDTDGEFIISNLPTTGNDYTIMPILDSGEASTPASDDVTVVAGSIVIADTFTVISAFGSFEGTVSNNGKNINTGILIIATTSTIAADPPDIDPALRSTNVIYYATVSHSDGTYTLDVRGGLANSYNIYAWYNQMSGDTPNVSRKSASGKTVSAGGTTAVSFSWP